MRPGDAAAAAAETTVDTLLRGRVTLIQPRRGFRSSIDPLLLARFLAPPHGRFLDIGCGTGALSFTLMADDPAAIGIGVELQPRLAQLASLGCARNGVGQRFQVVAGDIRVESNAFAAASFDLVATNPPFRSIERGVSSPDGERARANHEVTLALSEWLDCSARLVRPGGRLGVVYAAERLPELLAGMVARDLVPARLRLVHPFADRPAARVLVEAVRGGRRALVVEAPLFLHVAREGAIGNGDFSKETRRILEMDE